MSIKIIITGGTFDKYYDEIKGQLTFKRSHLPEILKTIRCTVPIELEMNQLVDSLDMVDESRRKVLEACRNSSENQIIITHGTDTMADTAKCLGEAKLDKVIVLTGAMIPYSITGSDAVFNLGCSITAIQLLTSGVYIVMNGRVFSWGNVCKNRQKGIFEKLV